MEYVYYWYHHMMDNKSRQAIQETIDTHNFEKFIYWYKKLYSQGVLEGQIDLELNCFIPLTYLPDIISVIDDKGVITDYISILDENNFNKITYSESECG